MSPFISESAIKVVGVKETQAALRALDGESQKLMKAAFDDVAQILIRDVKRRLPTGPPKGGHAADSVKSTSQQREGRIREGGGNYSKGRSRGYPYLPWIEFGGQVGHGRIGLKTGATKRKFIKSGRYLYPSLDRNYDEVYTAMHQALTDLLNGVDWTVHGGQ